MPQDDDAEPPAKMTKLAIVEEREEDKYEHILALRWYRTAQEPVQISPTDMASITAAEPHIKALLDGVMHSLSSGRQATVQAWEEELLPCEHTLTLSQLATGHIPPSGAPPPSPHHRLFILFFRRPQDWHTALNAISKRTSGSASPAVRSAAAASNTQAWVGTATRSRTLRRVSTPCALNWGLLPQKATLVSPPLPRQVRIG